MKNACDRQWIKCFQSQPDCGIIRRMSDRNPYRNILVRSLNWIGDAIMATPALAAVRQTFPAARITLLANPVVGQLFLQHPWVDQVVSFDRTGSHRGLAGRLRLAKELRQQHFDLALILPNSFDAALVPFLAGIPARFGKASDGRSLMLTRRYHAQGLENPHEVQYYRALLESFAIRGDVAQPLLVTAPDEDAAARQLLSEHGIAASDLLLGINAGATFGSAKRWYPERFAAVAQRLAAQWGTRVILFGGPDEVELVAAIEQHLEGHCLNLAGKTTVRQLMALIKRCDFFVTNDSGPMHIAAAFGVPLVAVFGPTDHVGTAPCSERAVVVRQATECAPCKLRACPTDHRCMTSVTVEDVVQAANQLWQNKGVKKR